MSEVIENQTATEATDTPSLADLKASASALAAQAEAAKNVARAAAVGVCLSYIAEFGIEAEELGFAKAKKQAVKKVPREPKYKGPNGELWAGGQGKRPNWVQAIIAAGGDIEQYRIVA